MGQTYTSPTRDEVIIRVQVNGGEAALWEEPEARWLGLADVDAGAVQLPANRLAFRGYVLDFSLFWARVALDYGYTHGRWDAWHGAWVYARGALADLVEYGRMLIHEMGHLHMGVEGHCGPIKRDAIAPGCCFDIAAEHWKCRVASIIGLPDLSTFSCQPDPLVHSLHNPCGGEGDGYALVCDRGTLCVPQTTSGFLAGPCA